MLPVNVIMPEDKEQMALTINGKKRNIHKKEFKILAEVCDIPANAAEKMIEKLCALENKMLSLVDESYLPQAQRDETENIDQRSCSDFIMRKEESGHLSGMNYSNNEMIK